jgi:carbon-monoxide dehydrogenase medium subunit
MKPSPFTHHRPGTIDDAIRLLGQFGDEDVRILAGGQSLIPMMAFRLARPTHLIDINNVRELEGIKIEEHLIKIGALCRHEDVRRLPIPGTSGLLLRSIVSNIAHRPIRTRGTFCGSIVHADPASEWCLTALTLDGVMNVVGPDGRRDIKASDWFRGAMTTAIEASELLVTVSLPLLSEETRFAFKEFSRRAGDFAIASALVVFEILHGKMINVRVGIGGAEDRPRRMTAAEEFLEGCEPSTELFAGAASTVAAELVPMEDINTNASYRRNLAATLVRRALEEASA